MEKDSSSGTRKDIVDVNSNTLHPSILSMCINGQWNATIENYKCTRKFHLSSESCMKEKNAIYIYICYILLSLITR